MTFPDQWTAKRNVNTVEKLKWIFGLRKKFSLIFACFGDHLVDTASCILVYIDSYALISPEYTLIFVIYLSKLNIFCENTKNYSEKINFFAKKKSSWIIQVLVTSGVK